MRKIRCLGVILVLLASACGTRLSHEQIVADADRSVDRTMTSGGDGGIEGTDTSFGPLASGGSAGEVAGRSAGGSAQAGQSGSAGGGGGPSGGGGGGGGQTGGTVPKGAPINIGQVGPFSGILGATYIGFRTALQAWVANVNAGGGINGHPVKLFTADDGGDGSRGLAAMKDMVENQKVVAFVATGLINTGQQARPYVEEKRVPVVGGDVTDTFWHESPMLFPQLLFVNNAMYGVANAAMYGGKKKVALLNCAELAACSAILPHEEKGIRDQGGEVVYKAQISVAQPDFTANCLQAQRNGANSMIVAADVATIIRVANSCARQEYRPQQGLLSADDSMLGNPNLNGAQAISGSFPWFLTTGSPALEEYGETMKRYAPSAKPINTTAAGWTAAKLFEKAAAAAIGPGDTPTSDKILKALWTIDGETLGGLVPKITFVPNQPAVKGNCAYRAGIQDGKWVAVQGLRLVCGDA